MKNELTIYLCLDGSTVLGAGKSLLKLFNNTFEMRIKSYHYYYRNMYGKDEAVVDIEKRELKIVKVNYAK